MRIQFSRDLDPATFKGKNHVVFANRILGALEGNVDDGEEPEDDQPEGYYEDGQDEENAGTPEDSDGIKSADDGLSDSHEGLAKSDKDNVH